MLLFPRIGAEPIAGYPSTRDYVVFIRPHASVAGWGHRSLQGFTKTSMPRLSTLEGTPQIFSRSTTSLNPDEERLIEGKRCRFSSAWPVHPRASAANSAFASSSSQSSQLLNAVLVAPTSTAPRTRPVR